MVSLVRQDRERNRLKKKPKTPPSPGNPRLQGRGEAAFSASTERANRSALVWWLCAKFAAKAQNVTSRARTNIPIIKALPSLGR